MSGRRRKNKISKLVCISDGERIRHLQHRAELELEMKRRKQQLIATFTKNKVKFEETFTRLNMSKINEHWRLILRQIKYNELYTYVTYLIDYFNRTIQVKDVVIYKFYSELQTANTDYRRFQQANIAVIDKLIGVYKQKTKFLHDHYLRTLYYITYNEITELNQLRVERKDCSKYLESVVPGQNEFLKNKLIQAKTRNIVNICNIVYLKERETIGLTQVSNNINDLWTKINTIIAKYEMTIENKKKHCSYINDKDNLVIAKDAFPIEKAQSQIFEILKNELKVLSREGVNIAQFTNQVKYLVKKIWKVQQTIKLTQTIDRMQLRCSSVISNGIIQDLENVVKKGIELQFLINICSDLKASCPLVKKHTIHNEPFSKEFRKENCVEHLFNTLEIFWQRFNYIKARNILMKKKQNQLSLENKKLRYTLRIYLINTVRIPSLKS